MVEKEPEQLAAGVPARANDRYLELLVISHGTLPARTAQGGRAKEKGRHLHLPLKRNSVQRVLDIRFAICRLCKQSLIHRVVPVPEDQPQT
jgi:hypothetical protein